MEAVHKNYINGQWVTSKGGQTYEQHNPADLTEVTGIWQKSTIEDIRAAIDAAQSAFSSWSSLTVFQRAQYLKKALALMNQRIDEIARVITAENGKTLKESESEIISAIKEMDFQISQGLRMGGEVMPMERDGVLAYSIRKALGPVAIICAVEFSF